MNIKEIYCDSWEWIYHAQRRIERRPLV